MDIFKQVMGFVLMGTVVFLFVSVPAELRHLHARVAAGHRHRLLVVRGDADEQPSR